MERTINAERIEQIISVFGSFDENIKKIEQTFDVQVTNRGTELKVTGDVVAVDKGCRAIEGLLTLAAKGETIDEQKVRYLIGLVNSGNDDRSRIWQRMSSASRPRASLSRQRPSASSAI